MYPWWLLNHMQLYLISPLTSTLFLVLAICESYGTSIHYDRMNHCGKESMYHWNCLPITTGQPQCKFLTWLKLLAAAEHSQVPVVAHNNVPTSIGAGAMVYPLRAVRTTRARTKSEQGHNFHGEPAPTPHLQVYQPVSLDLDSLR